MTTIEEREKAINGANSVLDDVREEIRHLDKYLAIRVDGENEVQISLDKVLNIIDNYTYCPPQRGSSGQQEKDISLTFSEGTLKYSCKDYVVYKKDWLRDHFDDERAIECGEQPRQQGWIPIDERLPEVNEEGWSNYILISCSNFSLPTIGLYHQEADGSGAFHDGDQERTMASYGLMVNAWMPLPQNYSISEAEK